jgi:hypothetical protein
LALDSDSRSGRLRRHRCRQLRRPQKNARRRSQRRRSRQRGQRSEQPAQTAEYVVVYRVDGSGSASSITYTTDGMTTTNQESILAQGDGTGKIDVTITIDGKPFKEAHVDGYRVAMANGNIGTAD